MKKNHTNSRLNSDTASVQQSSTGVKEMYAFIEPYVDADTIASYLSESRKTVVKMAREGKITAYPFSGRTRFTYKFKRSEVAADMQKIRRPATGQGSHSSDSAKADD